MSIRIGTNEPKAIKVGNRDVLAVYAGAEKVWPEESEATVLKLKAVRQNTTYSPEPYEVTDKTESPQWRFWMKPERESTASTVYTDMVIEEIPSDAEIKFVVVGHGGSGKGGIQGYGAGGGGEVIQYTLPAGTLKAGDKFRVGKRETKALLNYYLDFIPANGETFSAGIARFGGSGTGTYGGYGWKDGQLIDHKSNDGGSGAGGLSPDSNGDRGVYLEEWGETFGEGGFGGLGSIREYTIGMGGEGNRGGTQQNFSGRMGGVAFQSNVPIEVTS